MGGDPGNRRWRSRTRERIKAETPVLHRSPATAARPFDQRAGQVHPEAAAALQSVRGSGGPLSPQLRATFEERLGADLSRVRIHTDSAADTLSRTFEAKAFTVDNDVFFSRGSYRPGTAGGDHLLAHELTHVAQGGGATSTGALRVSDPHEESELEAEHLASHLGTTSAVAPTGTIHRTEKESLKVATDQIVQQYVEGFDVALGKWLADHPLALAGGEFLLLGIHKVLKKQFAGQAKSEADFLIDAFGGPAQLRTLPGAPVVMQIDDLLTIGKSTAAGSLRTKMSLVYMAIRCGILTAGMKAARTQSATGGGSQKARDKQVGTDYGLDAKKLREADISPAKGGSRNFFGRQQRVEQQRRGARGGDGTGLAAQEARTIAQSEFVGNKLSYDELKVIAKGDQLARTAATDNGDDFDTLDEEGKRQLMIKAYPDVKMPEYTPGFAVYRIDPNSAESKTAAKSQTGMVGGLSGSTDMYLHLASYLGASKDQLKLVRLAALGEMLPRRDHSFYEVIVAGQGYGLTDIDPTKGTAAYAKIPPLKKDEIVQGTQMALPSEQRKAANAKPAQSTLREDVRDVQASVEAFAVEMEKGAPAADLVKRWHEYYQSAAYRWAHDSRVQAALDRINAVLGSTTGVSAGLLTNKAQKDAALAVLRIVQQHSGNPTRVVPEVHASPAFAALDKLIGRIPANQVVAAYVKQYVGSQGLIIPSVQFATELAAIESGAKPLPPITEIGDKSAAYLNQIWPEAKSTMHTMAQQAEHKFAEAVAALDDTAPDYSKKKRKLEREWKRKAATGAVETWKRVQSQIDAIEALDPIEKYAIYTYTQGQFYTELNAALNNEQKLSTKERAVALAATSGLRKLPVFPGPVFRAQRSGARLRQDGVTAITLKKATDHWKPGLVTERLDFLSTFKGAAEPLEFMQKPEGAPYDMVVRIEKVKTGRWTLLLSAAEAVAAGKNPEHQGEVTFPPGARFRVSKALKTDHATHAPNKAAAYVETTWEEITPAQAAPKGADAQAVGDDRVPDDVKPQPLPVMGQGAPPPPIPMAPAFNGGGRKNAVALAPDDVQDLVVDLVAPPVAADLIKGADDEKLPEPPPELVAALVGAPLDEKE